ncbi:MAG: GNAT family N-acetyltransferase [Candidatus Micrarchaeota archaeon]|nr:GNAT family N-acetyltransferase [Candidatus Micrarchaeota archaeon]
MMIIRKAKLSDFKALYTIGRATPELKISRKVFMTEREFKFAIKNPDGLFLLAQEGSKYIGFAYCAIEGLDYACMTYDVVIPKYRGKGIGKMFIKEKEKWLRKKKIKSVYALATNPKIIGILKHLGYQRGKTLVWMEKYL